MAKIILTVCYQCKGLTLEEHKANTYGMAGGCAFTTCEMCDCKIANTALTYSLERNVYVKRGIIKNLK